MSFDASPGATWPASGAVTCFRRRALVNEAYLRLVDVPGSSGATAPLPRHGRAASCVACWSTSRARGRIRSAAGALQRITLDQDVPAVLCDTSEDVIAVDMALDALTAEHARKGQVVELRFFGGLSVEETAEALGDLARRPSAGPGASRRAGCFASSQRHTAQDAAP